MKTKTRKLPSKALLHKELRKAQKLCGDLEEKLTHVQERENQLKSRLNKLGVVHLDSRPDLRLGTSTLSFYMDNEEVKFINPNSREEWRKEILRRMAQMLDIKCFDLWYKETFGLNGEKALGISWRLFNAINCLMSQQGYTVIEKRGDDKTCLRISTPYAPPVVVVCDTVQELLWSIANLEFLMNGMPVPPLP